MAEFTGFEHVLPENTSGDDAHFLQSCASAIADRQRSVRSQLCTTLQQMLQGAVPVLVPAPSHSILTAMYLTKLEATRTR
jgi:hypothetical protein